MKKNKLMKSIVALVAVAALATTTFRGKEGSTWRWNDIEKIK